MNKTLINSFKAVNLLCTVKNFLCNFAQFHSHFPEMWVEYFLRNFRLTENLICLLQIKQGGKTLTKELLVKEAEKTAVFKLKIQDDMSR